MPGTRSRRQRTNCKEISLLPITVHAADPVTSSGVRRYTTHVARHALN